MTTTAEAAAEIGARFHPSGITQAAARFASETRADAVPEDVDIIARRCILDSVGLYFAGADAGSTAILRRQALHWGGLGESMLLGAGGARVPAPMAARVMGTAGHAHDWDDTQVSKDPAHVYGLLTHPSIPCLTAALVMADRSGGVSGRDLLSTFAIAVEVTCKISEWLKPDHYLRGHHSSGTVGTFGATVAAGRVLGLDTSTMARALGIAASMAAGVRCNFGTMTKPLHVGRAAENGVTAALMAADGFTADETALDGRWGFSAVLAGGFSDEKLAQGFGTTWSLIEPGISIKPYPSGILTHQSMDLARRLVIEHDIGPDQVESVEFYAGDNILKPIRYPIARTGLQAKFSMAALIALILTYRRADAEHFEDPAITDPGFMQLQHRIKVHTDQAMNAQGFDLIRSRMAITLKDGRQIEGWADTRYRGGPQLPLSDDEVEEKFTICVGDKLPDDARARLTAMIWGIELVEDTRRLLDVCASYSA